MTTDQVHNRIEELLDDIRRKLDEISALSARIRDDDKEGSDER